MKRRKPAQLTPRSIAWLRERGYVVGNVEKWIPQIRQRKDLFGFIDLLAVRGDETLGVQVTSSTMRLTSQPNSTACTSLRRRKAVQRERLGRILDRSRIGGTWVFHRLRTQ